MKVRLRFRCTLKGEQMQAYRVPRAKSKVSIRLSWLFLSSGYVRA